MDNVEGTQGIPLTVFGGAVPELAPEDLPEGASPFNQDVDYNPGSVFTRGGRVNQLYYAALNQSRNTGAAISFADNAFESAWNNPSNAQSGVINTDAVTTVQVPTPADLSATGNGVVVTTGNPNYPYSLAMFSGVNNDIFAFYDQPTGARSLSPAGGVSGWSAGTGAEPCAMGNAFTIGDTPAHSPKPAGFNASVTVSSGGAQNPGQGMVIAYRTNGNAISRLQTPGGNNGGGASTVTVNFGLALTAGTTLFAGIQFAGCPTQPTQFSVTDQLGNAWFPIGTNQAQIPGQGNTWWGESIYCCTTATAGTTPHVTATLRNAAGNTIVCTMTLNLGECTNFASVSGGATSQQLQCTNYGFSLPAGTSILGMQVLVQGKQNTSDSSAKITVQLMPSVAALTPTPTILSGQLTLGGSEGTTTFGTQTGSFGLGSQLTPALVNSGSFGVTIQASANLVAQFSISGVFIKLWLAPSPSANFNWIKTYEQTDAEVDTLALDANGVLWDEDVDLNPGNLTSIFTTILPNTFGKSVTFQDIEYIAFSNLLNGTDCPRQWNGTNLDRISMVGPGAKPTISTGGTGTGGSSSIAIQQISQGAPVQIRRIAWGTVNSPADSTPGNQLVIYGEGRTGANTYQSLAPYTPTFGSGTTVILQGVTNPFPKKGGGTLPYNINGSYTVGTVQTGIVGGSESCPTFTLPSPTTTWAYSDDFGTGGPPPVSNWWYQSCIATVTTQQPVPNVGVNSQIQIAGTGTPYDGTWTVIAAPNSSAMTITSVILVGNIATYTFTLQSGYSAPTVGQTVTISNCLNGSGIGDANVFNTTKAISAVGASTFSINITSPDIPAQNQTGTPAPTAVVGGTTFMFDAGQTVNFTSNSTQPTPVAGGTIVQQGQIASGIRKCCYSFLTRSGYITQPSPITQLSVTGSTGSITVSGLSVGPPNVVARIVFFTAAGGGNFFYIPQTVNITNVTPPQTSTATIVNDNLSTTATFNFSDAVLLSATAIDIPGNNLFNTIELGSSRGMITYSSRMFAWGEQLKVTNFRNLSFDGGYSGPVNAAVPLGWTIDPTNGTGGALQLSSPVFGWSYQISNTSGVTKSVWGMLTQGGVPNSTVSGMVDEFGVPIIQASTLYSVRICASVTAGATGNLVVDLFSPSQGVALGTFTLPLNSMTTGMQIYSGTLLTTLLQPVPSDLQLRIWAQNISNLATITIDRVEPFQTLVPVNTTALKGSYVNNQEAFDLQTGVCGPAQNMQPINGAALLYDLLYALKERSWFSTFDNGVTEPNLWNWKTVSDKVGCVGQNAYDSGEGWVMTANREGIFFFEGGEPIKVSQELQPLWDTINWTYGYTIWLRNDPEQRRFTVGIPIPTPNPWMPEFPTNANPTSPNCVLMCNYRELNTGAAIAQTGPIRSTYMGRLMSPEPARKWSFWNITCPYSDYIDRNNNNWPQWFCTGYTDSKIFALQASSLSDDGGAINSFWISYGFTKAEQQDAKGLGLWRVEFPYLTVLATGSGTLNTFVYPESPFNNPYDLDILPLPTNTQGDLELGVNIKGNRFFIRVGTNAVGSAFRVSKMVVPLLPDTWSPVRGFNAISA